MKKICYICDTSGRDILHYELSKVMERKYGTESIYLCFSLKNVDFLQKKGVKRNKIHFLQINNWEKEKIDMSYLEEKEKETGINLWYYWGAIRSSFHNSYRDALKMIQREFKFYDEFFAKTKPDAIINDAIASMPMVILNAIAEQKKLPFLQAFTSKTPGKFILRRGTTDEWFQVDKKYKSMKGLTSKEKKDAEAFVQTFKKEKQIPTYEKFNKKKKLLSLRSVKLFLSNVHSFYLYKGYENYRAKGYFVPFRNALIRIWQNGIKKRIFDLLNPFGKINLKEKYILFPLHYQPEASTLIYAPFYTDQIYTVQSLAKCIPAGYKLYVKEHSNGYGRRDFSFFKKIKNYPNIKLVPPKADIHKLVQHSQAVIVITSTTGWEALLYDKPVLTLGNVFFNTCKNVERVGKMEDLPKQVEKLVKKKNNWEETLKYISAMQQTSYEGTAMLPGNCGGKSLEKNNLEKIAAVLGKELNL